MVDSGFSGVVLLARGRAVLLRKAYNAGANRLTPESRFWIGSMTKGFTAAAILRLVEQKRLALSDSIGRFIPDVPPDKQRITIQQLLTHTSGIDGQFAANGETSRDNAVHAILAQPMASVPGSRYRYMDDDYVLLAAIVEIASGARWNAYVNREIVARARLRHTSVWPGDDWGHVGANGMSSTADDLLRWVSALREGRVLTRAHSRLLEKGQVLVREERGEDIYYGYGVRVYEKNGRVTEVMHSGSSDDLNTGILRLLRRGLVVIVLSNAGDHGGTTWSSYAAHHLPLADR